MIKSNLRWPGGKSKMVKNICPYFPKNFGEYYELFAGGSSIGLYVIQQYDLKKIIFNDIDSDLINYYRIIQNPITNNLLIKELLSIKNKYNSEEFKPVFRLLKISASKNDSNLENAKKFFIANKSGFSGIKKSTYSKQAYERNFTIKSINKCKEIGNLLADKNVLLENSSFENALINTQNNFFVYADPPYYGNSKKGLYGKDGLLHKEFDHILFHEMICEISKKNKILISYDNNEFIKQMYSNFKINFFEKKYSMTNTGNNLCKMGQEILISNY